ncbi:PIN domain-containing protein [Patescibacteria group bacterium]|nr:PIN domain-containing protein [Patescibacteria group bacterium]
MILIFDTTTLSRLLSGDSRIVQAVGQQIYDHYVIPLATDAEMRFGFANGSKEIQNIENYELFKSEFGVEIFSPNQDTSIIYAELAAWAKQHGVSLSNNDLWIAATSNQLGGRLITLDSDFKNLPQISLVDIG